MSITEEDIAFGKKSAQHDSESRNLVLVAAVQNGDVRNEVVVNDGDDEVIESASLLHDTAGKTMSPTDIEGGRESHATDISHADTGEALEELLQGYTGLC